MQKAKSSAKGFKAAASAAVPIFVIPFPNKVAARGSNDKKHNKIGKHT